MLLNGTSYTTMMNKNIQLMQQLMIKALIIGSLLLANFDGFGQVEHDSIPSKAIRLHGHFDENKHQLFGFSRDSNFVEQQVNTKNHTYFKSIGVNQSDYVDFVFDNIHDIDTSLVSFKSTHGKVRILHKRASTWILKLPAAEKNYTVYAKYKNQLVASLHVYALQAQKQTIVLIPLLKTDINTDSITQQLNRDFQAANVSFDVYVRPLFETSLVGEEKTFINPNPARLRYTRQMQQIREEYFERTGMKNFESLLFFVGYGYDNASIQSYMVKNKALGFLTNNSNTKLAEQLRSEYLRGYIHFSDSLIDSLSHHNHLVAWQEINNSPSIYSYIDDYEDVATNNGLIAYYFFEQDKNGDIFIDKNSFLASVMRPMKRNTYSYHLQIDSIFFQPLLKIKHIQLNLLHFLSMLTALIGLFFLFRSTNRYIKKKVRFSLFLRVLTGILHFSTFVGSIFFLYWFVNLGYHWFEVQKGEIKFFEGKSTKEVLNLLYTNVHPYKLEEKQIGTEVITKTGKTFSVAHHKKVMYFKMIVDQQGEAKQLRLDSSSNNLHLSLLKLPIKAESHYMVLQTYSEKDSLIKEQLFNHLGVDLTEKISIEDPPKRILLFVNGYRPTSLGRTFEENFADIQQNGLEFPNSMNRIFTEDRYNYWHPWKQIDDLFKQQINPGEVFYADGHHSVATSNHRNIINFSTLSKTYPKRCEDSTNHVCYKMKANGFPYFGKREVNTYSQLATKANVKGFKTRMNSGRIAGRNLYQILNELPNQSKNDTLYIVAHSMGFAYAQGIVNQLRGSIHFGGYYIIAPENAKSGTVQLSEWNEVWQYGSNLGVIHQDAPCLQDGVAPQSRVNGLPKENCLYIPAAKYTSKGFFDSHFIGWYTWIFDIPPTEKGAIKKH